MIPTTDLEYGETILEKARAKLAHLEGREDEHSREVLKETSDFLQKYLLPRVMEESGRYLYAQTRDTRAFIELWERRVEMLARGEKPPSLKEAGGEYCATCLTLFRPYTEQELVELNQWPLPSPDGEVIKI